MLSAPWKDTRQMTSIASILKSLSCDWDNYKMIASIWYQGRRINLALGLLWKSWTGSVVIFNYT